jgi:DNA (cytosine-5)-methyltransferase 1
MHKLLGKELGAKMKTAVSLFAGVGGFDLALERAGVKVVASVEWDKKAQDVLRRHFPESTIFGDISGVTGEQLIAAGFEPRNGIITGGFPCQDLSVAGRRAGLGGSRSGLFWEICRLLDETRAQNFILENVPGLLSSNQGADMAVVLEALVERGYRIAYRVLDAQHFGVPQRRRRVFIVGSLGDRGAAPEEILSIAQGRAGYIAENRNKRKNLAAKLANGASKSNSKSIIAYPMHGAMIGRNDSAGPSGSGFLAANEPAYTLTSSSQARHCVVVIPALSESSVRHLTPVECERLQGFPDGWTDGQTDGHRYKQMGNAVAVPVVQWIVSRMVEAINE